MGKPAARITDMHICPKVNPGPVPHVGGPIVMGSPNVLIGNLPAARVGDMAICVGPPDKVSSGSSGVFINGKAAARVADSTAHGGKIIIGMPTVLIGEKGGSGGGTGNSTSASVNASKTTPEPADVGKFATQPDKANIPLEEFAIQKMHPQAVTLVQAEAEEMPYCEICEKSQSQE